jgi:KipI family sensor histidine kinase inhibitor
MSTASRAEPSEFQMSIDSYGDSAVLVRAYGGTGEQRWRAVQSWADLLEAEAPAWLDDVIATYDSVLVEFDCDRVGHHEVAQIIRQAAGSDDGGHDEAPARSFRIPVVYDAPHGPDLAAVAAELELTPDEVVDLHTSARWVIRFRGAPAGAPMLDGAPFDRPVSRCPQPRTQVPPGSVALAGLQGVIYPVLSPGGWRLIGATPLRLRGPRTPATHPLQAR